MNKRFKATGIPEAIGVLIFVSVILAIYGYISVNFLRISVEMETAQQQMEAIDIAHVLKSCLSKNGIINYDSIEGLTLKQLKRNCNIPDAYIKIMDAETNSVLLEVGRERKKYEYKVFVPLLTSEGKINIGEIYVKK
jgi:hypothetical protein